MQRSHHKIRLYIPFLWLLFIMYGSFIPFQIRPVYFIDAIRQFKHIPFLNFGIVSREDWVSNILLYIPLGFFLTGWISKKTDSFNKNCLIFLAVFIFCILMSVFIEFSQIFFAMRTASLNDVLANAIGSLIGIFLWFISGQGLIRAWLSAKNNSRPESALSAFLFLYMLSLFAISLFPFDFLFSAREIELKYGMWKAQPFLFNVNFSIRSIIQTVAEAALFIPAGGFIGLKFRHSTVTKKMVLTFLLSFFIGFGIEFIQFFTASGISEFFSVVVRVLGAFAGLFMVKIDFSCYEKKLKPYMKYIIMFIFPIYLVIVLKLSGWSETGWLDISKGFSRFDLHMMLPFYFDYFSTETRAVLSVLFNFGLYVPVGFSGWLLSSYKKGHKAWYMRGSVILSMFLSLFIETGRLFQKGLHPDFTNIIIAGVSAAIIFKLSNRFFPVFQQVLNE